MNRRRTLTDQLRHAIFSERYPPGEMLPSEPELMRELNAGRSSVREAIANLTADGILHVLPGRGTRVCSWLWEGSFDLFTAILKYCEGNQIAHERVRDLLWLRRTLYVQLGSLLLHDKVELDAAQSHVFLMPPGLGYPQCERTHVLRSEEHFLCLLAVQTYNIPASMLAQSIRRILQRYLPLDGDLGPDLVPVKDRCQALVTALATKDTVQAAALFDELCRLREDTYVDLARPAPAAESAATP